MFKVYCLYITFLVISLKNYSIQAQTTSSESHDIQTQQCQKIDLKQYSNQDKQALAALLEQHKPNKVTNYLKQGDSIEQIISKYLEEGKDEVLNATPFYIICGLIALYMVIDQFQFNKKVQEEDQYTDYLQDCKMKGLCVRLLQLLILVGLGCLFVLDLNFNPLNKSKENFFCAIKSTINGFYHGDSSQEWIGIKELSSSLNELKDSYTSPSNFDSDSQQVLEIDKLNKLSSNLMDEAEKIFSKYRAWRTNRVDPKLKSMLYQPSFIETLGPAKNPISHLSKIDQYVKSQKDAIISINNNIKQVFKLFEKKDNHKPIYDKVEKINEQLKYISRNFSEPFTHLDFIKIETHDDKFIATTSVRKQTIKFETSLYIIGFYLALGVTVFVFSRRDSKFFLSRNHLFGCAAIWLSMVFSITLLKQERVENHLHIDSIRLLNDSLQNQITYKTALTNTFNNSIVSEVLIDTLIEHKNEIPSIIGIDIELYELLTLFKSIQLLSEDSDTSHDSSTLNDDIYELKMLKNGVYFDSGQTQIDLQTLNQLTNSKLSKCGKLKDTWVLDSRNCTKDLIIFKNDNNPTSSIGDPVCLPLDMIKSPNFIDQRYKQNLFNDCPDSNQYDYTIEFLFAFQKQRELLNQVFGEILEQYEQLTPLNSDFLAELTTQFKKVTLKFSAFKEVEKKYYHKLTDLNLQKFLIKRIDLIHNNAQAYAIELAKSEHIAKLIIYLAASLTLIYYLLIRLKVTREDLKGIEMIQMDDTEQTEDDSQDYNANQRNRAIDVAQI